LASDSSLFIQMVRNMYMNCFIKSHLVFWIGTCLVMMP